MIVALLDSKVKRIGTELLPLNNLLGPLVRINHAQRIGCQRPAIHMVQAEHVIRRSRRTLLFISVNLEVIVVRTVPNQTVNGTRIRMERKEHRLICREELGELLIGKRLVVLLRILDLEKLKHIDKASLNAQLAQHIKSCKELHGGHVTAGCKDDIVVFTFRYIGSPFPLNGSALEFFSRLIKGNPCWRGLLACENSVDAVSGRVSLLAHGQQKIGIGRVIDVYHVVIVVALVEQNIDKARILVREAVVILSPHVAGKQYVDG